MSTLSQIIQRGFRESQILDIDRAPSAAQEAEALVILNGIIKRHTRPSTVTVWLGDTKNIHPQRGTILKDFTPLVDNRAIPQDTFVNLLLDQSYSVMLPPEPGDGAKLSFIDVAGTLASFPLTLLGNGNLVAGNTSATLSDNNSTTTYLYRRDLANWQLVSTLLTTSSMPFPEEFDDMFVIELAIRLNPRYGKEISGVTAEMYQQIRSRFIGRYTSENSSAAPDNIWEAAFNTNGDIGRGY